MAKTKANRGFFKSCIEDIAAAFMLLTRIPVYWDKISNEPPNLRRATWAYPLVGLFIGGLISLIFLAAIYTGVSKEISILLALSAAILTTGAFHEDGLADVADGFGGGYGKEKKLEIMRDSRVGTYGSLALIIAFAFKFFSLHALGNWDIVKVLIVAATVSRFMILVPSLVLSPARSNSLATEAGKPTLAVTLCAATLSVGTSIILMDMSVFLITVTLAFFIVFIFCRLAYKQVGGFSGDILGATQQLSEIAILVTLSTLWRASS